MLPTSLLNSPTQRMNVKSTNKCGSTNIFCIPSTSLFTCLTPRMNVRVQIIIAVQIPFDTIISL